MTHPSRRTFTGVSSFTVLSTSNRRLASYSNQKATPVARKMAQKIPIVSANSPSMKATTSESNAATSSTLMIGSSNFPIKSFHTDSFLAGVITFSP